MGLFQREDTKSTADDDEVSTEHTSSTKNSQQDEEVATIEQASAVNVTTYVVPKKQQSSVEDIIEGTATPNVTTYVVPKKFQASIDDASTDISSEDIKFLGHSTPIIVTREGDEYVTYFLPYAPAENVPIDVKKQVEGCWFRGPLARVEGYYDSYHYVAEWFFKIACACLIIYLIFPTWYLHSASFSFFALTLYNEFSCILDMKASLEQRHWSSIYSCMLPLCVGATFYAISWVPMQGFNDDIALRVDGYVFIFLGLYLTAAIYLVV